MYEAKFLTGAIAGAISESGHIGYAADYPTYGMIADINAFALGAKMVNPRAVIDLEWFTTENWDRQRLYHDNDVAFLSGPPEDAAPDQVPGLFGLYSLKNGVRTDIALPMWHWGRFYELLIRSTLSGSWKNADPQGAVKALNYWWGLSAGVVDVICSRRLSPDTEKLIELLKQAIIAGTFNPFAGILRSQEKVIQTDPSACLSPVEIITMDWLNENVQGHIPTPEEMIPSARPFVRLQGIGSREQQWTR